MKIYGYVEKGIDKSECQDRVLIGDTILAGGFLEFDSNELPNMLVAIADGVGGNVGGERASLMAVDSIRSLNRRSYLAEEDIRSLVACANTQMLNMGNVNAGLAKMATTLTALAMNEEDAFVIHIGNCRLGSYKKYLQPLTKDQTVVAEMVSRGELTKEQAKVSMFRNQISACMGGGSEKYFASLVVESQEKLLTQESNLILTSDGIHDYLDEEDLEELLNADIDVHRLCKIMATAARENGSVDDISIIIVDRLGRFS